LEAAIITPVKIYNFKRFFLNKKSFESLELSLRQNFLNIIVLDYPSKLNFLLYFLSDLLHKRYIKKGYVVLNGNGKGSLSALKIGLHYCVSKNINKCFLNLDDHIFIKEFHFLSTCAIDSLNSNNDLVYVRLSGYPLIGQTSSKMVKSNINVCFDNINLLKKEFANYNLWYSYFDVDVFKDSKYWFIPLWFCYYKVDFLISLFNKIDDLDVKHLGQAEDFIKNNASISLRFINKFSFGFINMQFGGFEMHRNRDYKKYLMQNNYKH
jgi:hypothetical protein